MRSVPLVAVFADYRRACQSGESESESGFSGATLSFLTF
jgi:hypothetical protein